MHEPYLYAEYCVFSSSPHHACQLSLSNPCYASEASALYLWPHLNPISTPHKSPIAKTIVTSDIESVRVLSQPRATFGDLPVFSLLRMGPNQLRSVQG